jgi:RNA polymerase primary sigma factor
MQIGRKPTEYEQCHYLRVSSKTLMDIKKACLYEGIQSLDELIPGTEDMELGDCIPDSDIDLENNVVDGMIENSKRSELWRIVKDSTTSEENTVIIARYQKSMSLEATGQIISKTREAVRSIEAKALRKLRRSRITRQLEEKFEINYARAYRGSLSRFNNTWNSIVEDIVIKNLDT